MKKETYCPMKKTALQAKRGTCHDCGVKEGEIHRYGCDMERCPFCGHQLITCDCANKALYPGFDPNLPHAGLPVSVYLHGFPQTKEKRWLRMLEAKGRVPYIRWPNHCDMCGALWPDMFSCSHEDWERYVQIDQRNSMLCRPCYDKIKNWIDEAAKKRILADG